MPTTTSTLEILQEISSSAIILLLSLQNSDGYPILSYTPSYTSHLTRQIIDSTRLVSVLLPPLLSVTPPNVSGIISYIFISWWIYSTVANSNLERATESIRTGTIPLRFHVVTVSLATAKVSRRESGMVDFMVSFLGVGCPVVFCQDGYLSLAGKLQWQGCDARGRWPAWEQLAAVRYHRYYDTATTYLVLSRNTR